MRENGKKYELVLGQEVCRALQGKWNLPLNEIGRGV